MMARSTQARGVAKEFSRLLRLNIQGSLGTACQMARGANSGVTVGSIRECG